MSSDTSNQRKEGIESRFAAEKQRTEARYDKQIESLVRRKEAELDSLARRKETELQRLENSIELSKKIRPEDAKLQQLIGYIYYSCNLAWETIL